MKTSVKIDSKDVLGSVKAVDEHVGVRLRLLRLARGWSQGQLGKQVGLSYQQVQKYESGRNRVGAGRLWQFCQIFDVEPNVLFDGLLKGETKSSEAFDEHLALVMNRQNHNLMTSFSQIDDPDARRAILSLCDSLKRGK